MLLVIVISLKIFFYRANDDPHGIFALKPETQQLIVTQHMARLLRINVTRDQGSFDKVAVGYSVEFNEVTIGCMATIFDTFIKGLG